MKELLITIVFFISAVGHDIDLANQADKGSVTFWTSNKVYKICKDEK